MLKTRLYSAVAFLIAFTIGVGLGQLPLKLSTNEPLPIACSFDSFPRFTSITAVAFSPNNQLVVSGDSAGHVCLWRTKTQTLVWTSSASHIGNRVLSLAFSPGGTTVVALSKDGCITTFDVAGGEILQVTESLPKLGIEGGAVQFTSAGETSIMVFGGSRSLRNWAKLNGREDRLHPFDNTATCVTWSAQANRYGLGNQSGLVKLYDRETFSEITSWATPFSEIQAVALSPSGKQLIASGKPGFQLISTENPGREFHFSNSTFGTLTGFAFSQNERWLVAGDHRGKIVIWSIDPEIGHPPILQQQWLGDDCCQGNSSQACSGLEHHLGTNLHSCTSHCTHGD